MKYKIFSFDESTNCVTQVGDGTDLERLVKILDGLEMVTCGVDEKEDLVIFYWEPRVENEIALRDIVNKFRSTSRRIEATEFVAHSEGKYVPIVVLFSEASQTQERRRGIQYWDSSIWQRWVVASADDEELRSRLTPILREINAYHKQGLYSSPVTREYCEFSTRIYKNSYLLLLPKTEHGNDVVPFPFFQEGRFRENFRRNFQSYRKSFGQLRWRVLLVDDRATEAVATSSVSDENVIADPVGKKLHLIKDLLAENFEIEISTKGVNETFRRPGAPRLSIECAETIDEAFKQIESKHYDVVLLDYLLGKRQTAVEISTEVKTDAGKKREKETNLGRELGVDFLKRLETSNSHLLKVGPDNRFWIFSVTSFSWAFIDHLREVGLSQYNERWTFARGADPVNTPNAFLYYFAEFLNNQLNEFKREGSLRSIWEKALITLGLDQPSDSGESRFKRMWANTTLNSVLSYWNKYESLRELITSGEVESSDDTKDSLFAKSFLASDYYLKEVRQEYNSGLYGYLTHFLFLLSFSDGYEWEEMKTDLAVIIAKIPPSAETRPGYKVLKQRIENLQKLYIK